MIGLLLRSSSVNKSHKRKQSRYRGKNEKEDHFWNYVKEVSKLNENNKEQWKTISN